LNTNTSLAKNVHDHGFDFRAFASLAFVRFALDEANQRPLRLSIVTRQEQDYY